VKEPYRQNKSHCIHTKNIYSLLDLGPQDLLYDFLNLHQKKCTECAEKLLLFKEQCLAMKVFVPKPYLPKDLRETFNGELSDLFKISGLNDSENEKKKIKESISLIDKFGEEFFKSLLSEKMMAIYAVTIIISLCMKYLP
jgi:hypothetical protein